MIKNIFILMFLLCFYACGQDNSNASRVNLNNRQNINDRKNMNFEIIKSEEEWSKMLTPEQYHILRKKGTERPHTGKYDLHFEDGLYKCAGCGNPLFKSDTKFDAHCGWPSFNDAIEGSVIELEDRSYGMIRTEIVCSKCGGHLGHLFDDGPEPTGLRYCINSVSLDFQKSDSSKSK